MSYNDSYPTTDSEFIITNLEPECTSKATRDLDFINNWVNDVTVENEIWRGNKLRKEKRLPYKTEKDYDVINIDFLGSFRNKNQHRERKGHRKTKVKTRPCAPISRSPFPKPIASSAYTPINRILRTHTPRMKTKNKKECTMRIAELAVPTKRQCIDTWRNKCYILPEFMVERLKQYVMDQRPIVKIPEAIFCFQRRKSRLSKKSSENKNEIIDEVLKPFHKMDTRALCIIFGYKIAKRLSKPLNLTLNYDLEKLSRVIASDIGQIIGKCQCKNRRNKSIHTDVSNKITVWIAGILEDLSVKLLEEDLRDLEEEEGPVLDFIDDVVDNVMNICEPPPVYVDDDTDKSDSSKDGVMEEESEKDGVMEEESEKPLTPTESTDKHMSKLEQIFNIVEATDDFNGTDEMTDIEHFRELISNILNNIKKESGEVTNKEPRVDISKETGEDISKDTGEDISKEPGEDYNKETGEDISKETGEDISKETGDDISKEQGEDIKKDTGEDISKETGEDISKVTGDDIGKKPREDISKDTGEDISKEPGEDYNKETGEDISKEPGQDINIEPGKDINKEPREDINKEAGEGFSEETGEDISKETGDDISKETGEDISKEPGEDINIEPGEDINKEPGEDINKEAWEDFSKETGDDISKALGEHYNKETGEDISKELGEDINIEPGEDINKEPGEDISKEPGEDINKEPGEDINKEPGEDINKETGKDISKETGEDINKETGEDISKDPGDNIENETNLAKPAAAGIINDENENTDQTGDNSKNIKQMHETEEANDNDANNDSNVSEVFDILSEDSGDDKNSKKVKFSVTDLVNPDKIPQHINTSTVGEPDTEEQEQAQWNANNENVKANIIFSEPNIYLLSDADESWPAELTDRPMLKVSDSASKSITSLGRICEHDEKLITPLDDEDNETEEQKTGDTKLEEQAIIDELYLVLPNEKYNIGSQTNKASIEASEERTTVKTETSSTTVDSKTFEETNNDRDSTVIKTSENKHIDKSSKHQIDVRESGLIKIPSQITQSQIDYGWKVHPNTAPSWVTSWDHGRGEPSENSIPIQIRRPTKVRESDLRKWCKDLENAFINLEMWNDWIDTTCKETVLLLKQKEIACPSLNRKHVTSWIRLKKNIDIDTILWTKLHQRTDHNFKSLKRKYNNIEIVTAEYSACTCTCCKTKTTKM